MNKYQEALGRIISFMNEQGCAGIFSKYYDGSAEDVLEELVERATPNKPRYEADGYADGKLVYDTAYCPNCDKEFECDYGNWGDDYCPDCGQALCWREEE